MKMNLETYFWDRNIDKCSAMFISPRPKILAHHVQIPEQRKIHIQRLHEFLARPDTAGHLETWVKWTMKKVRDALCCCNRSSPMGIRNDEAFEHVCKKIEHRLEKWLYIRRFYIVEQVLKRIISKQIF